jgi:hypothetical protein
MRIATRTLLTLILVLAVAATAFAQGSKPNIGEVMIVLKDIDSKAEIGAVEPGGIITLPPGMRVRLIMTALPTGRARGPLYPDTTFSDRSRGGVTITRSNVENSTADLVIGSAKNGRTETIRYQIHDTWVPAHLRTGSFRIHVDPNAAVGRQVAGLNRPVTSAEQLTRMLYQAILLRDLDPGAQGTIEALARGGYDAVVKAAVDIASSEESRLRLPDQGVSAEQRLESLYRHLLGLSRSQVSSSDWNRHLLWLHDGRIADVVYELVNSDRFRDRIGL